MTNGNLVYRQRDIDVEGPAVDLEVERYYNSQLPESKNTEWGDGWTLAQTPDLEAVDTGGSPVPDEADLLESSGAFESEVELPAEAEEELLDPGLQATLTKKPSGGYELKDETGKEATSVTFNENGRTEAASRRATPRSTTPTKAASSPKSPLKIPAVPATRPIRRK